MIWIDMKNRKNYFNDLAMELAFSGPVFCRFRWETRAYPPDYGRDGKYGYAMLPSKSYAVLFRGPKPAGEHVTHAGSAWLVYAFGVGPVRLHNPDSTFDEIFEKVVDG